MKPSRIALLGATIILPAAIGVWVVQHQSNQAVTRTQPSTPAPKSPPEIQSFLKKHADVADPKIQDQVGRARIQLAYVAAQKKDFKTARATLKEAAKRYKGTGQRGADYGSIPDQAEYQAIVCLVGEGKQEEARKEFRRFIKERPLSPLASAAYRRLERLNGGQPDEPGKKLLDVAVAKQQAHIRFETSVCGPKAIAHLLKLMGKPTRDYRELAKLCGTTDEGTTMEGMQSALEKLGIATYGLQVNRRDFAQLRPPFIVLRADHYVVATSMSERTLRFYDPRYDSESKMTLPSLEDETFSSTVLATSLPTLNANLP